MFLILQQVYFQKIHYGNCFDSSPPSDFEIFQFGPFNFIFLAFYVQKLSFQPKENVTKPFSYFSWNTLYVEIYLMLVSFNMKYISVFRGFMARSNIITHKNTHISIEIIQGIQNTYRSTLSLVFPPPYKTHKNRKQGV